MKRRNIDTMREIRLWIRDIVVPVATFGAATLAIPEVREAVATKANHWKESMDRKFKKKKEGLEVLK